MKRGDLVGGYVLTTDPREGGGNSQWAFARKDGTEFFIKRFLAPTYPLPGGPGSAKTKADKRVRCEEFERHHRWVMSALRPISGEGSNLVITKAFFRDHAHYYKVTNKVDVSDIGPKNIAGMPRDGRILIMLTASRSLDTLHRAGLVHGDVKPENLLIKQRTKDFAVNVIDFDNCFAARRPPQPATLVGDPTYYSPELLQYILHKATADQVDEKNDVFALGLVFWQYLTGSRPGLPDGFAYAAEAVQDGAVLSLPKRAAKDRALADVVSSMLAKRSADRPSMGEVHSALKDARRSKPHDEPSHAPKLPPEPGLRGKLILPGDSEGPVSGSPGKDAGPDSTRVTVGRETGRLRGKGLSDTPPAPEADKGKLRGSLIKDEK
jgi:eukaryotic-like serine/threonine-protein kinase